MRRTILLLAAALTVSLTFAQSKNEVKSLGAFLAQTSATGQTNAAQLGVSVSNVSAMPGIKV